MKRSLTVFILFFSVHTSVLFAQFPFPVPEYTDSLRRLGEKILGSSSDFSRFEANEKFKGLLIFMLSHDGAYDLDFTVVKNLSALTAPDKKFRIFTWVVPRTDMSYECFGLVYSWNERKKAWVTYELEDVKNDITNPEKKVFRKNEWWGALYYELIPVKSNGSRYYTLLGWDGSTALSNRKVIEVLSFNPLGQPSFGASLFSGYGKQQKRIIFEYADFTQMVLRYEKQAYVIEKKKKNTKKNQPKPDNRNAVNSDGFKAQQNQDDNVKRKRKPADMIVFDHLIPMNSSLNGQYQYYVPEVNIVDGFIFKDGKWLFKPDIDARNAVKPQDSAPPKDPKSKIPELITNY
jgi:hypothetical protein